MYACMYQVILDMCLQSKFNCKLATFTPVFFPSMIKLWNGGRQFKEEIQHHSATRYKAQIAPFPSAAAAEAAVIKASYDFPAQNGNYFACR